MKKKAYWVQGLTDNQSSCLVRHKGITTSQVAKDRVITMVKTVMMIKMQIYSMMKMKMNRKIKKIFKKIPNNKRSFKRSN